MSGPPLRVYEAGGVAAYDPAADRWRMLPPSPELTGGGRCAVVDVRVQGDAGADQRTTVDEQQALPAGVG